MGYENETFIKSKYLIRSMNKKICCWLCNCYISSIATTQAQTDGSSIVNIRKGNKKQIAFGGATQNG